MEEKDIAIILSEKYNKKVKVIESMISLCYKFDYRQDDINKLLEEFFDNAI